MGKKESVSIERLEIRDFCNYKLQSSEGAKFNSVE